MAYGLMRLALSRARSARLALDKYFPLTIEQRGNAISTALSLIAHLILLYWEAEYVTSTPTNERVTE